MAIALLFTIVALLAIGEFLLFGAVAEAYRDIRQMREQSGLIDRPMPVELGQAQDQPPSLIGLNPSLTRSSRRSRSTWTAAAGPVSRSSAASAAACPRRSGWSSSTSRPRRRSPGWAAPGCRPGLPAASRVSWASPESVERNLGGVATPLAIDIEHGRLVRAKIITSVRQFYALVPATRTLVPSVPEGVTR